jgi:hypothetical protein
MCFSMMHTLTWDSLFLLCALDSECPDVDETPVEDECEAEEPLCVYAWGDNKQGQLGE